MSRNKRQKKRNVTEISVSFLDVISCGFGAIVLLLLIAKTVDPSAFQTVKNPIEGSMAAMQQQLFKIRGETTALNLSFQSKEEQLSDIRTRIENLKKELAEIQQKKKAAARLEKAERDRKSVV
jgi:TolA-binding protein